MCSNKADWFVVSPRIIARPEKNAAIGRGDIEVSVLIREWGIQGVIDWINRRSGRIHCPVRRSCSGIRGEIKSWIRLSTYVICTEIDVISIYCEYICWITGRQIPIYRCPLTPADLQGPKPPALVGVRC